MDFLNALSIELCDSVLCCNSFYTDGKPPNSPSPVGALSVEPDLRSNPLSKHSSVDPGEELPDKHLGWEQCDIRKPQKLRPTLKQLAEEYIVQQKSVGALREALEHKEKEKELVNNLQKDASFVTTDGDDDSMELRASSFCSVTSNIPTTKKDSSRDISCDEMEDQIRPNSKLETDSKDSGYGAEPNNRAKRKLVKFHNQNSIDADSTSPQPEPSECDPDMYERKSCPTSNELSDKSKKKTGLFSSFRSKKGPGKEIEEEKSSSSKKKRKKKGVPRSSLQFF